MSTKAIANGANEAEQKAARDANEVQDGVNLIAIVGAFHRHLLAMRDSGIAGMPSTTIPFLSRSSASLTLFAASPSA